MAKTVIEKKDILDVYDDNVRLYQSFLEEIEHQVKSILQASGFVVNAVTARLKSRESLSGKLKRKPDKYSNLSDITDIVGIRIITYFSEDVDRISDIVENEFDIDRVNSIDKRESMEPDRFGYCSVHYVVQMSKQRLALRECARFQGLKCEIQIRSVLQHAWAEIEHDLGYKSEITIPKEMRRDFSRIAGLLEIADKEFNYIRSSLSTYKQTVQAKIENNEISDQDLDAVILEVFIKQDANVLKVNKHIEELTGVMFEKMSNNQAENIIQRLKWLGVTTVQQLADVCLEFADSAILIASERLKDYREKEDRGTINDSIAFFYLCYALLLKKHCTEEQIRKYFEDTKIGLLSTREAAVKEFYNLGLRLNR